MIFYSNTYMQGHVAKCWNRVVYMRKKRACIFLPSVGPSALLKLLEQYQYPNACGPKLYFLCFHSD